MPLEKARARARAVANSPDYADFVASVRKASPWRFERIPPAVLERDYLRLVDHYLERLLPRLEPYLRADVRRVCDFGCGSGGSAVALALVYPDLTCIGTDIDATEVRIARERAKLYGVADRCQFDCVPANEPIPFPDASFDLCVCSSVLEYVVGTDARRFCVREMARLLRNGGLLVCSVPNRLYPFEIHTGRWGWNYFPNLLRARIVDCTAWEVKRLARPLDLKLHKTPVLELLRPWSNFCMRRDRSNEVDAR